MIDAGALDFENIVLVASGIGITPALSCLQQYKAERRIMLVWMCRDPTLIEFFLEIMKFDDAMILIYYTGKQTIKFPASICQNVKILSGRPDVRVVVAQLISSSEKHEPLPPSIVQNSIAFTVKSVLSTIVLSNSATPLNRFETMMLGLLNAGIDSKQILTFFIAGKGCEGIDVGILAHTLQELAVDDHLFEHDEVAGELNRNVSRCFAATLLSTQRTPLTHVIAEIFHGIADGNGTIKT